MLSRSLRSLLVVASLSGCDTGGSTSAQSDQAMLMHNGPELNGAKLNGAKLNGAKLNGAKLNGAKLNGAKLNGAKLNGASLSAATADGTVLEGLALVGVELEGQLSDGNILPLRIDGVRRGEGDADIVFYTVSYFNGDDWQPLCGTTLLGGPVPTIALAGTWNYGVGVPGGGSHTDDPASFTLACMNAALGKCAGWGYAPWRTGRQCTSTQCREISLADHHQACTRMVRADYCGDGRPWTFNGTSINIYDGIGVNADTEGWLFEAEWRADGASCVRSTRAATGQFYHQMPGACVERLSRGACGDRTHFAQGTLLMSEYYIWWQRWGNTQNIYQNYDPYQ